MAELLTSKEAARFYKWSVWAKPFMVYTLTVSMIAIIVVACYLLISSKTTMNETSTLLITMVSAIAPVLAAIVLGKSYERGKGVRDEEVVPASMISSPASVSNDALAAVDPDVLMSNDPSILLNKLDLTDYLPKVADDKPEVD